MKKMGEMQHVTGSPFIECVIQEQEKKKSRTLRFSCLRQSVSEFHDRVVLTSSSFCWLSTNEIRPPEEGQFDHVLGNQI